MTPRQDGRTYLATLWRCQVNFGTENAAGCNGYRYTEVGAEPGPCGHETVHKGYDGGLPIVRKCTAHMISQGDYELED